MARFAASWKSKLRIVRIPTQTSQERVSVAKRRKHACQSRLRASFEYLLLTSIPRTIVEVLRRVRIEIRV